MSSNRFILALLVSVVAMYGSLQSPVAAQQGAGNQQTPTCSGSSYLAYIGACDCGIELIVLNWGSLPSCGGCYMTVDLIAGCDDGSHFFLSCATVAQCSNSAVCIIKCPTDPSEIWYAWLLTCEDCGS